MNCFSYYNTHKKFNYKPMLNVKYSCLRTREKHFHGNPTMGIFLNYRLQQQLMTRKRTVIAIAIEVHFYVYARLIYFSITCNFLKKKNFLLQTYIHSLVQMLANTCAKPWKEPVMTFTDISILFLTWILQHAYSVPVWIYQVFCLHCMS